MEPHCGEVYCAVHVVSSGGHGVHGGKIYPAVRDLCTVGSRVSEFHSSRFSGGREAVDFSPLHSRCQPWLPRRPGAGAPVAGFGQLGLSQPACPSPLAFNSPPPGAARAPPPPPSPIASPPPTPPHPRPPLPA